MEAKSFIFLIAVSVAHEDRMYEPSSRCSRFDYEYKVLERLVKLEQMTGILENKSNGLEDLVEEQRKEIMRLKQREQFHTVVTEIRLPTKRTFAAGETVIFTHPVTNTGNAYNTEFGLFEPPINGTYSFSATLCTNVNTWIVFGLMLDTSVTDEIIVGDSSWHQCGTSSMVTYVTTRNKIWVKVLRAQNGVIDAAYGISSFTGMLLTL